MKIERETERKIGALIFVAALIMIGLRLNSMYPGWGNIWWDLWCMVIGAIAVHGVDEDEYLS